MEKTKNEIFFTPKKIIFLLISLSIFSIFIYLIYEFFFKIEFSVIIDLIKKSYNENDLFFLWLVLLIGYPIYSSFFKIYQYYIKLKQKRIYVEWYNWISFCFITTLIASITPFSIGAEPYIIYWLKKRGLTTQESTSIVASFMVLNPFIQIIITWPSFFILCSSYADHANNSAWVATFWTVFVGLIFDLMGSVFWVLISISKNAHYFISLWLNKIKKIFRFKYKTKEEIKREYIDNSSFKQLFLNHMKDVKFVAIISIGNLIWNIYCYSTLIFAFNLTDPSYSVNGWDLFNYVNVASTANNFVPIPGAEGTIQTMLLLFIKNSSNQSSNINNENLKFIIDSSVVIWRTFTFYLTAIIGVFFFFVLIGQEGHKARIKNIKRKRNIANKTFTIIIPVDNDLDYFEQSIKTISLNDYDSDKIQIIVVDKDNSNENRIIVHQHLAKYKNIDYCSFNFNNWSNLLNYVVHNNLIKNDYVTLLEPRSFLNFNILENVNNIIHDYDIYVSQYRVINDDKKLKIKKRPYWYLFKRTIKEKDKMYSPKMNPFNTFVKKELFNDYFEIGGSFGYQMVDYFNFIVKKANSIRYIKKMNGNWFINKNKWEDKNKVYFPQNLEIIQRCIYEGNAEIVVYNLKHTATWRYIKKNNIKFYINKKIEFKWVPIYFRWVYKIVFYFKYKDIFILNRNISQ